MGENTIILATDPGGVVVEIHSYDWYENHKKFKAKGYKFIDSYNEAFKQHREYAERLKDKYAREKQEYF